MEAPISGQISKIMVQTGDVLEMGAEIARITPSDGGETAILTAPFQARILEVQAGVGAFVQPGSLLIILEKLDEPLEAIIYISPADGKSIEAGMPVQLQLSTAQPAEYGYLLGTVETVGQYPATAQEMMLVLGSADLLDLLAIQGGSIEVHVALTADATNPSGYAWTSGTGLAAEIQSGTLVTARIILQNIRPIDLVRSDH